MEITLPTVSVFRRGSKLFWRLCISVLTVFSFYFSEAQVNLTATLGIPTGTFPTLHDAFAAINSGQHQGTIVISITSNIDEGTTPAVLYSRDADPCSYLSVTIQPTGDNISIIGTPPAGRGLIELNGADFVTINGDNPGSPGINRNLTISNNSPASTIAGSCIRIATAAAVGSADNNSIVNCILSGNVTGGNDSGIGNAGSAPDISFGIYIGGNGGFTNLTDPTPITVALQAAPATSSIKNTVIQNNQISQCGRAIMFNSASALVSNNLTVTQNDLGTVASLGAFPFTSPATTVYKSGVWVAGTNALTISQNNIQNIISFLKVDISGIELNSNIGSGSILISDNSIQGVANNSIGSGSSATGILVNSVGAPFSITGNNINEVHNLGTTSPASGIKINSNGGIATINLNKILGVNNHQNTGSAGGILLTSAANGALIQNNFIANIMNLGNNSFAAPSGVAGIGLYSGSLHRVNHNSVYLYGASPAIGTNIISCLSLGGSAQTDLDIRNNIFANKVSGGAANNAHVCLYFPFAASSSFNIQVNNNAYFSGSSPGISGVAYAGSNVYNSLNLYTGATFDPTVSTGAANWRSYSSALGYPGNDLSSFGSTGAVPFVSGIDLHITPAVTPIESGGAALGVAKDIDGDSRNMQYPDMGADEFNGTASDITGPLISYTPLDNTCSPAIRQLVATITDFSGVSSTNLPELYWSVNAGAYTAVTAVPLGGNQYQFSFGAGLGLGDVVNYYIVAQDIPGNASVWPSIGASGFSISPPAVSTAPTAPSTYSIQGNMAAGTYDVGVGQTYTTITDALNAYNNSCPQGAIVFRLMDATYPSETFPLTINNPYASAVNTLTILPNTGVGVTVTDNSASAIFKLNGADYVTIDGLNAGGSSLTVQNNNPAGIVIWVASKSATNGATHNTIQNCILRAGSNLLAPAVIFSGGGTRFSTAAQSPNSYNSYIGNELYGAIDGIFEYGPSGSPNQNLSIISNKLGSTAINADKLGGRGIEIRYADNVSITGNTISGITSSTNTLAGIGIYNLVTNVVISENKISDITQTTNAAGAYGIWLQSASNTANIRVSNNFIWAVNAAGSFTLANNSFGILIASGGGYSIWFNSILMATNQVEPMGIQAALRISSAVTATNAVDIRNNIFSNTATLGVRYAVYSNAAPSIFSDIDYNLYYTNNSSQLNFLGTTKANLFEWQTTTGKDAHSLVANPSFVSVVNLHLATNSAANAMAGNIASITTDIDGDARVLPMDIGADEMDASDCLGMPAKGTITATVTSLCSPGPVAITVTGYAVGDYLTYQWQSAPAPGGPYTDIAGATVPSNYAVPMLATTTSFRLKIFCPLSGQTNYSDVITATVNSPVVSSTTPQTRCGPGTVNLLASTATPGATLKWYAAASGGTVLGSGPSFTTPIINSTTTYYVGSSKGNNSGTVGPVSPTAHGGNIGTMMVPWDVYFDVLQPTTLESVDIFPMVSGSGGKIYLKDENGATLLTTNFTTNVSGGVIPQTINLNYALPIGTGYVITCFMPSGGILRNESGSTYPYSSPAIKITGNNFSSAYFMGYYNWKFTTQCESTRTPVIATVTAAPSINATATPASICAGATSVISATSSNAGYTYIWTPGNIPGASTGVSPATTTTYTVKGTDASGGANNGCINTKTVTVTVRPIPAAVTVTPNSGSVCSGGPALLLSASNGLISNITAYSEKFNATTNNWVAVNNSTGGIPANAAWTQRPNGYIYHGATFNSNDATKFYLSNSDAQGSGSVTKTTFTSPAIDLTGFSSATLSYYHHLTYVGGETAVVEVSPDGSTWAAIPGGTYTGSVGTPGNFVNAALNLDAYAGMPVIYIRFRYEANWDGWWAIDNISITGSMQNQYTWTQTPVAPNSIFNDAAATIPYVPGTPATNVYVLPAVNSQYTLTSSGPAPSNCGTSANATITITPLPTVSITNSGNPVCPGTTVFYNATVTNAGPSPTYQWQVNGANVGTNISSYSFQPGEGDVVKVIVTSSDACSNGLPFESNKDTMHVQSNVPVLTTISANPGTEVCENTTVTFTATVVNGGTTPVYEWRKNGSIVGTNSPTYSYVPTYANNGDAITCTVTSNSTCIAGPNFNKSDQILLTVHDMGNVSVTVGTMYPNNTVCTGTQVTVVATPTHPGSNPIYEFFLNGVPQPAQASNNYVFTPNNGDRVKVRLTSNYACLNTPSANQANSNTITLSVLNVEPVSVGLSHTNALCTNVPIVFTALPSNEGSSPVYDFYLNGSVVQTGPSPNYTLLNPSTGDFVHVQLTSNRACITDNPAVSADYTISLTPGPSVSVSASCTNLLAGSGQVADLTATATSGGGSIDTYQWYLAPSTPVGTNSPTFSTNVPGSYYVVVTNTNGCSNSNQASPTIISTITAPLAGGIYVIPGSGCSGFQSIAAAVNYINSYGVAGAVTFAITPGYTETAPEGGYSIRATGTAANTITFDRDGAGANPVITASPQFPSKNNDGIFKILGGDYIRIRNLTMQENPANTVMVPGPGNTMTEWGVALLYATPTNGPSNNIIENNIISLNKNYPNSFGIYSNMRHDSVSVETQGEMTNSSAGNNKIYGNSISNVNIPILFVGGVGNNTPMGNDIGGSSSATGNILTDWGTNALPNPGNQFYSVPKSLEGILVINQGNVNVSWNSISNAAGIDAGTNGLYGVKLDIFQMAPAGSFTNVVSNNSINLNSAASSSNAPVVSILSANSQNLATVTNGELQVLNNSLTSSLPAASGAANLVNILNQMPYGLVSYNGNNFIGNNTMAGTGEYTGILNDAAVQTSLHADNNHFGDAVSNAVNFTAANSGMVRAIYIKQVAGSAAITLDGNSVGKFQHDVTGSGNYSLLDVPVAATSLSISNNIFNQVQPNTSGTVKLISASGFGSNKTINSNQFTNITATNSLILAEVTGGGGANSVSNNLVGDNTPAGISAGSDFTAINLLAGSGTVSVSSNIIKGITATGNGAMVYAITSSANTANINGNLISGINTLGNNAKLNVLEIQAGDANISSNEIQDMHAAGTGTVVVTGVSVMGGNNINLIKNKLHTLTVDNSVSGSSSFVNGFKFTGGTQVIAYNNFISHLLAPLADGNDIVHGMDISSSASNSNYRLYFNSVYLDAASTGTDFGSSALFHTTQSTATTAALDIRNNIFDNESVASGSGITVAYRRSSSELANYSTSSNYNVFYAGQTATPGALYFDGTTAYSNLVDMQTALAPHEANSLNAKPVFISNIDLHLDANGNCAFEGRGIPITGIVDDIDGDTRNTTTPDIGADEFTGLGGGVGVWAGVNSNWLDPINWCGAIPNMFTDVVIPGGKPFYPIITTNSPVSRNILIQTGGSIQVTGAGQLAIYGTMSSAGNFDVADGTIELAGTSPQNIPASIFVNDDLKNLVINNNSVSLDGNLKIYGKLSFLGSNRTFATNDNLVLRSVATGTASLGDITNNGASTGNSVTGNVSVERFVPARRAWRFLSVPTAHNLQTIHEAWQENLPANSTVQSTPPGYGIHITKDSLNWSAYGFDLRTPVGPSMKTYVPATNTWKGITSTIDVPGINNGRFESGVGYMIFVRGDRTVNTFPQAATPVTLRDKGALVQGNFASIPVPAGLFQAIGNPYASAIDFSKLTKSNIDDVYYMWDPQMGSLGAYVTFTGSSYTPSPSISYTSNHYIESGQAFFVHSSSAAGSVTFTEPSKVDGSYLVTRQANIGVQKLKTLLYAKVDNHWNLFDGTVNEFDSANSNAVDGRDAIKPTNSGENLGIKSGDKILSVERHATLNVDDTIHYNLTQVRATSYRLGFVSENLDPLLTGYLVDRYLNTSTVVNLWDTTWMDISIINDPGSYAPNRFYLIFKRSAPVPVTFLDVKAAWRNKDVLVSWDVAQEENISHYEVERSANGSNFEKMHQEPATGSSTYTWLDTHPLSGDNFYRIRSVGTGGDIKYSQIVKVSRKKGENLITVYPNPVKEDGILYVGLQNTEPGNYQLQLLNEAGQVLHNQVIRHIGGSMLYSLQLKQMITHGNYILKIVSNGKQVKQFKLIY